MPENSPSPSPYFFSQKWFLGSSILAVLLIGFGTWLFLHAPASKNRRHHAFIQPVAVQRVIRSNMPVILTELGTVIPITTVTVQTRISGYLLNVLFKEGQHVHKGEELATIDPRPYEVLLKQYEGQLARDRAQLEQARVDSARYQRLIKQDSIDAKTAQDQLFMIKQLEGTVKSDQALVDNEKLQLLYCHITAPIDGRIGIRAVDKGNYVAAGQSGGLAILTQMQPISVIFTIPQNQLPEVLDELHAKKILPVEAWNSTNTAKIADGTTSVLDSEIDTSTGTVRMRAIFPNQDENLFPNQFVNAHLKLKTLKNVLLVPNVAVQTGPSGAFVYVVQADHTVKVQPVVTGISDATDTVILSGVTQGEEVVTDGTDHLRNGTKVVIPAEMFTKISHRKGDTTPSNRTHLNRKQSP